MATAARTFVWKTNGNVLSERIICIKNRVGAVCLTQNLKMGRPWSPSEKKLHINVLELKAVQFASQSLTNLIKIRS